MSLTRRSFLQGGAALGLSGALGGMLAGCSVGGTQNLTTPLSNALTPAPPGPTPQVNVTLDVLTTQSTVFGGAFNHRSYNGAIGGPTIRCRPGDLLQVTVNNSLGPNLDLMPQDINIPHHFNTTNLHVHGLHVSPQGNSDNIFVSIDPGTSFLYQYQIPLNHTGGTYWYHPHNHGSTAVQLFSGMSGALIIEGALDLVPEVAAARDVVFMINELNIVAGAVPNFHGPGSFQVTNDKFTVNGLSTPTFQARPGEVIRFRVINASSRATIPFSVESHPLNVISVDGLTLTALQTVSSIRLAAANRADILIKASTTPGTYAIQKAQDSPGGPPTISGQTLAFIQVSGAPLNMGLPSALPVEKALEPILDAELNRPGRTIVYHVGPTTQGPGNNLPNFTINGARFDPNAVGEVVDLGAVEEWTLENHNSAPNANVPHPHHIHINPFYVTEVFIPGVPDNGKPPLSPPLWMDTIDIPPASGGVPGHVKVRSRFVDFTGKFVMHCHILTHEDAGMMRVVQVV